MMKGRYESLDALRGWAICGVVLVHSGQVAQGTGYANAIAAVGQYGVQLFFVVSALTIAITYDSHLAAFGSNLRAKLAWAAKRLFRIAPLYYLAILIYRTEFWLFHDSRIFLFASYASPGSILANILLINTWVPAANNSVVPGGWSIGAEVMFYALIPLLWSITKIGDRIAVILLGSVSLFLLSATISWFCCNDFIIQNNSYLFLWFPSQASVFAAGLTLYLSDIYTNDKASSLPLLATATLLVSLAVYFGTGGNIMPALSPPVLAVAYCMIIVHMAQGKTALLSNRIMVLLGKISYGIYIFHFLVLDLIKIEIGKSALPSEYLPIIFIAALAGASLVSLISRIVIENPAIEYGHRFSARICGAQVLIAPAQAR